MYLYVPEQKRIHYTNYYIIIIDGIILLILLLFNVMWLLFFKVIIVRNSNIIRGILSLYIVILFIVNILKL